MIPNRTRLLISLAASLGLLLPLSAVVGLYPNGVIGGKGAGVGVPGELLGLFCFMIPVAGLVLGLVIYIVLNGLENLNMLTRRWLGGLWLVLSGLIGILFGIDAPSDPTAAVLSAALTTAVTLGGGLCAGWLVWRKVKPNDRL